MSNPRLQVLQISLLPQDLIAIRFTGESGAVQSLARELVQTARWEPMLQAWCMDRCVLLGRFADRFDGNLHAMLHELEKQANESL